MRVLLSLVSVLAMGCAARSAGQTGTIEASLAGRPGRVCGYANVDLMTGTSTHRRGACDITLSVQTPTRPLRVQLGPPVDTSQPQTRRGRGPVAVRRLVTLADPEDPSAPWQVTVANDPIGPAGLTAQEGTFYDLREHRLVVFEIIDTFRSGDTASFEPFGSVPASRLYQDDPDFCLDDLAQHVHLHEADPDVAPERRSYTAATEWHDLPRFCSSNRQNVFAVDLGARTDRIIDVNLSFATRVPLRVRLVLSEHDNVTMVRARLTPQGG